MHFHSNAIKGMPRIKSTLLQKHLRSRLETEMAWIGLKKRGHEGANDMGRQLEGGQGFKSREFQWI